MRKTVLIVRPEEQARETQNLLAETGFESDILPLMQCHFLERQSEIENALMQTEGIILTSVNGLHAFKTLDKELFCDRLCLVVGQTTAEKANLLGFKNIIMSPSGGARGIVEILKKDNITYLYSRAETISIDIKKMIGNRIKEVITYKMTDKDEDFSEISGKLHNHFYDAILVYSTQTARRFLEFVENGKNRHCKDVIEPVIARRIENPLMQSPGIYGIASSIPAGFPRNDVSVSCPVFCLSPQIQSVFPDGYTVSCPDFPSQEAFLQHLKNFLIEQQKYSLPLNDL